MQTVPKTTGPMGVLCSGRQPYMGPGDGSDRLKHALRKKLHRPLRGLRRCLDNALGSARAITATRAERHYHAGDGRRSICLLLNRCRSPMAVAFARSALEWFGGVVSVMSLGLLDYARNGEARFDLSGHRSAIVSDSLSPLPDLIITMTGRHIRRVADIDPTLLPRTFTLRELARRSRESPRGSGESLPQYINRLSESRKITALSQPITPRMSPTRWVEEWRHPKNASPRSRIWSPLPSNLSGPRG